ncbi:DMT family transporter [Acetobacteraceae bacterium H6797]|nr:DMT family transporter [Acetobacteraceae bacterium H6797]
MALVGANVGVAKLLAAALPIPLIAFLRCVLACLVLYPLARLVDGPRKVPRELMWNLFWQAALGTVVYNSALLAGLRLTSALEGGLMLASLPAVVAIGSALFLRERLSPRQWAAVALAAGGMAALTLARVGAEDGGSILGNALVLLAVCGEAAYVLLAKRVAGRVPVITASLWMQVFSAAQLLLIALPGIGAVAALGDPTLAGLLVFHSLTSSVLCLLLWYNGLKGASAGIAGVFTMFLPATSALVAILLLGETATALHAAGLALMLTSMALATWPSRRR